MDRTLNDAAVPVQSHGPTNLSFLRHMLAGMSPALVVSAADLAIVEANPALTNFLGYAIEELRMTAFLTDVMQPEDRQNLVQKINTLSVQDGPASRVRSRFKKKNGSWTTVELILSSFANREKGSQSILIMVHDISEREHARTVLENSEKMHRLLAKDLIAAQEGERRGIVLELHDVIGGNLGAAKYLLEMMKLQQEGGQEAWKTITAKLSNLIVDTMNEVQRISTSLRPPGLDDMGVLVALGWFVRKHNEIYTDMAAALDCSVDESIIPGFLKIVLFRLVQEALNNAAKHSSATQIEVSLKKTDNKIILHIADNGVGFDAEELTLRGSANGLGLRNMQSRVGLSDGNMVIKSQINSGTVIQAEWDLPQVGSSTRPILAA